MKLKKLNRGLVLGAVLVIGTVVHVVWTNYQFKKNAPELEQQARDYAETMMEATQGSGKVQKVNAVSWYNNNMVDISTALDDCWTRADLVSEYEGRWFEPDETADISLAKCDISDVRIRKRGETGAMVTFSYDMDFEWTGERPVVMTFDGTWTLGDYDSDEGRSKHRTTIEGEGQMYMVKVDGEWRLAALGSDGFSSSERVIEEAPPAEEDTQVPEDTEVPEEPVEEEVPKDE